MARLISYRLSVAVLGAALVAFLIGRLTAPRPRLQPPARPAVCPHAHSCPYCEGWDAFQAGKTDKDNPYPDFDADHPLQLRRRWVVGWSDAYRAWAVQDDR
jgi:hypothetical protein